MPKNDFLALLRTFVDRNAEIVLVGGLAAVLRGAPVQTFDVDLVFSQTPENIDRLLEVLTRLDAISRVQPERRLRPNESHLAGSGHLNLLTRHGPLDLLATTGQGLRYEYLQSHSSPMRIDDENFIRVLHLDAIIELKEQLGGDKDRAVLPILRQTLNETQKRRN